ncbi:MAG: ABC transporter ATP-binding protein [candidate division Zixibacteria bacterium]|nr:ABC transporter ATP-binding protein [candidate division Zixibacteria bacterium]
MIELEVTQLTKRFGRRRVFGDVSFALKPGQSLAVTGPNGSGKSTLLRLLTGLSLPTAGKVIYTEDGKTLGFEHYRRKVAMVAPYLALYGALTAGENLHFLARVDGRKVSDTDIEAVLHKVGLDGRGGDYVGAYSSGMQQRLKYAAAMLREPEVLLVDEPSANLDDTGKKAVFDIIAAYRKQAIVVIATNEKEEYSLADGICQLGG